MSRDKNTKAFSQQKRHRRQWLTFVRMLRYGANNFTRNAWLTIAATAVMTITLLIIFSTVVARDVLMNSVDEISRKVDMSIYLRTETTSAQAAPIIASLKDLSNVQDASFTSSEQARERNAKDNKTDQAVLNAINQATNKLPATIRVNLKNINDTSQLDNFVKTNAELKKVIDPERAPSFAGSRRTAIQNLARWTDFALLAHSTASFRRERACHAPERRSRPDATGQPEQLPHAQARRNTRLDAGCAPSRFESRHGSRCGARCVAALQGCPAHVRTLFRLPTR